MTDIPGFDFEKLFRQTPPTSTDSDVCKKCGEHLLDCECEEADSGERH